MLGRLCVFGGLCEACDDWYANGHFCCFDCLFTVFDFFDDWYTVGTVLADM